MIIQGNALHIPLADESVHCIVTSPPYWNLRNYKVAGQLGLEPFPDCLGWATGKPCGKCYVCQMVAVFREVKRVLRRDGTCWLVIGDSYAGSGRGLYADGLSHGTDGPKQKTNVGSIGTVSSKKVAGLKPKDLCLVPARLALALQADGWWLRSDIIWAKPNSMPESVRDRPVCSHEHVFLLAKAARYYYDSEAIKDDAVYAGRVVSYNGTQKNGGHENRCYPGAGPGNVTVAARRNKRDVWHLATRPFLGAHFATFPFALVEPCILAGTSAVGVCPQCGAPWRRVIKREKHPTRDVESQRARSVARSGRPSGKIEGPHSRVDRTETIGWQPTCSCVLPQSDNVPAVVLDPFVGSGTTVLVAERLGRRGIGLDLSHEYCLMAQRRMREDMPLLRAGGHRL